MSSVGKAMLPSPVAVPCSFLSVMNGALSALPAQENLILSIVFSLLAKFLLMTELINKAF